MISKLANSILLILCLSGSYSAKAATDNDNQPEAEKLLQQAEQLTDIRSSGSHSFRLVARVQVFDKKGHIREGIYNLLWQSPTVWRDELKFADFTQVRTAAADKIFINRNIPSFSMEVLQLLKLLKFPDFLRSNSKAKAQNLRESIKNGSRVRTIDLAVPGNSPWKVVSLDEASPIPTRIEYKKSHYGYKFENYMVFAGHQYPRTLVEFDSNKPLSQVQVEDLTEANFDASTFIPSADALWLHWCPHPEGARLLEPETNKTYPFPSNLPFRTMEQHVVIYGIIGGDGRWHNLAVVKSAGKEMDEYWLNMVLQQRYSPAKCGEVPIEEESVMEFSL